MKTIQVKKPGPEKSSAKQVVQTPVSGTNLIKLTHQQGIKQSTGYQTGDVVYGIEMFVENTPAAVKRGIETCENIVENALGDKLPQMCEILKGLAAQNR